MKMIDFTRLDLQDDGCAAVWDLSSGSSKPIAEYEGMEYLVAMQAFNDEKIDPGIIDKLFPEDVLETLESEGSVWAYLIPPPHTTVVSYEAIEVHKVVEFYKKLGGKYFGKRCVCSYQKTSHHEVWCPAKTAVNNEKEEGC